MRFEDFSYGSLTVDGKLYSYDLVLDRGEVRKRRKKPSKQFKARFGHTPVSVAEDIPWRCHRLLIGTGVDGALPVMPEVEAEARRRKVALEPMPTEAAVDLLNQHPADTNAILHITC